MLRKQFSAFVLGTHPDITGATEDSSAYNQVDTSKTPLLQGIFEKRRLGIHSQQLIVGIPLSDLRLRNPRLLPVPIDIRQLQQKRHKEP